MDYDRVFLSFLNSAEVIERVRKVIKPEYLSGNYADIYKSLLEIYEKYGFVKIIEGVNDHREDGVSLDFVMDKILERARFNFIKKLVLDVSDDLKNMKIDEAEYKIRNFAPVKKEVREKDISDLVSEVKTLYEKAKSGLVGVKTPWKVLDSITMGWQKGCLYIVASRTGIGKTWFLVLSMKSAEEYGKRVLFVSCEMPASIIAMRFYCLKTGVQYSLMRNGMLGDKEEEVIKEFNEIAKFVADRVFVIESGFRFSIEDIMNAIDDVKPDLVLIDGLYLIKPVKFSGDRFVDVSEVVSELKSIAIEKEVPIVASTQFNRQVKGLNASTFHLSLSDETGWDADYVFGLLRTEEMEVDKKMFIKCLKARESETIDFFVRWDIDNNDFRVLHVVGYDFEDDEKNLEILKEYIDENDEAF